MEKGEEKTSPVPMDVTFSPFEVLLFFFFTFYNHTILRLRAMVVNFLVQCQYFVSLWVDGDN
jgi:hypothetical protein